MHLVLPFASATSAAASQALSGLHLPHLERLLARLSPATRLEGDELCLSPPHERVLAAAWGWPVTDGLLPLAAQAARADGLAVDDRPELGWGLLSPTHWHVGTEQVSLVDPATLGLDEATSRALFDAVKVLFNDDDWSLHWGTATRWYARHASLATLPTASLDRVVGRNVDLWLTMHPDARWLRRLQAEVQMLLYTHPVNDAREAARALPVNSFWLSGTGRTQPAPASTRLTVDDRLRAPALAEDWAGWAEDWAALDAGSVAALLGRAEAGEAVQLTLCGERHAQTYAAPAPPWWKRLLGGGRVHAAPLLAAL
jgi:hypothetical protein